MTLKQTAEKHFNLIYPYIKQLSANEEQEHWLLGYYYEKMMPYAVQVLESKSIANPKEENLGRRLYFLKQYFDYDSKATTELCKESVYLLNQFNHIHAFYHQFQNAYFLNIYHKKPGFHFQSFCSEQYIINIRTLLQLTALFWAKEQIKQEKLNSPQDEDLIYYENWVKRQLLRHKNNCRLPNSQAILEPYKPSLIWFFFNGSNRLFTFLQLESLHLKQFWRDFKRPLQFFQKGNLDVVKMFFELPICAVIFTLHILFFCLLPYRLLRSIANEIFDSAKGPIENFIQTHNPHYKINAFNYSLHLLFLAVLYASLLTVFWLPLLPMPLLWLPQITSLASIALIPGSYMILIPFVAVAKGLHSAKTKKSAPEEKGILLQSGEFITLEEPRQNSLLIRYQNGLCMNQSGQEDGQMNCMTCGEEEEGTRKSKVVSPRGCF